MSSDEATGRRSLEEEQAGRWEDLKSWIERDSDLKDLKLDAMSYDAAKRIALGLVGLIGARELEAERPDLVTKVSDLLKIAKQATTAEKRAKLANRDYDPVKAELQQLIGGLISGQIPLIRAPGILPNLISTTFKANILVGEGMQEVIKNRRI